MKDSTCSTAEYPGFAYDLDEKPLLPGWATGRGLGIFEGPRHLARSF